MQVLALTGGVGGAKLGRGLAAVLAGSDDALAFAVNVGDDFDHLGLRVCPDLDTLTYTLANEANADTGWGRRDESFRCMEAFGQLGGETWFRLGDRDLAVHVRRSQRLREGATLSTTTAELTRAFGIRASVFPASDQRLATVVLTPDGPLAFQHYFVRDRCAPTVTGFRFDGADEARVGGGLTAWLAERTLDAVVICPSNPFVSIDPILAVPGLRQQLRALGAPIIAVSPIVGGEALKGPTAKMMDELGVPRTATAVASHYAGLLDGFVLDDVDAASANAVAGLGLEVTVTNTVMRSLDDRIALAHACLQFSRRLQRPRR